MSPASSKRWILPELDLSAHKKLISDLGIRPSTAAILIHRGIRSADAARLFLEPTSADLIDPFRLKGMDRAVDRIRRAIQTREEVVVYGDYDVDGVTATALYLDYFKSQGLQAGFYIPQRMTEGYGLNPNAIRTLRERGVTLLITADCGTSSVDEIRLARSLGMDVIVTDHHEAPEELPPATALLNPKLPDSGYPEQGLCTAGLTWKVIQALSGTPPSEGLDLVALGTVADVSPLTGENRYLVREGLRQLTEGTRPGVRALKEAAGLRDKNVGTGTIGFTLAPRINAAGRLSDAGQGVRLMTTQDPEEARRIALALNLQNQERQRVEEGIVEEALRMAEAEFDPVRDGGIVLASRNWHPGVIGIVAARLVERYYRPVILLAIDADGVARGSARSISGFHLVEGLKTCADLLIRYGGHRAAAGLMLREEKIPALRERFSAVIFESLDAEDFRPRQMIDAAVRWSDLDLQLVTELGRLAPFGPANPEPSLLLMETVAVGPRIVGENHLKFAVGRTDGGGGPLLDVIGFRMADRMTDFRAGSRLDLVFTPERNVWQGREQLQLRLKDLRTNIPPATA